MPVKTKKRTLEDIQKETAALRLELLKSEERKKFYRDSNLSFFFMRYKWQRKVLSLIFDKNIVIVPAPNKIGKTAFGANIVISVGYGDSNLAFEGSNDKENWHPLTNKYADVIFKTSDGIEAIQENPMWTRPEYSEGTRTGKSVTVKCFVCTVARR